MTSERAQYCVRPFVTNHIAAENRPWEFKLGNPSPGTVPSSVYVARLDVNIFIKEDRRSTTSDNEISVYYSIYFSIKPVYHVLKGLL